MPPLAGSAVNGARRIATRRLEMAQGRGTRGYITRASTPKEVIARLESDRLPGRGRGRGEQREARANWRSYFGVRLPNRRKLGRILHAGARSWEEKHRAANLDFPRACCPLRASDEPVYRRRWLDVCRQCGRQADSVGRRWYLPSLGWAWPISKWYDGTRPWCSVCWAESTNCPCIKVSCGATKNAQESEPKRRRA